MLFWILVGIILFFSPKINAEHDEAVIIKYTNGVAILNDPFSLLGNTSNDLTRQAAECANDHSFCVGICNQNTAESHTTSCFLTGAERICPCKNFIIDPVSRSTSILESIADNSSSLDSTNSSEKDILKLVRQGDSTFTTTTTTVSALSSTSSVAYANYELLRFYLSYYVNPSPTNSNELLRMNFFCSIFSFVCKVLCGNVAFQANIYCNMNTFTYLIFERFYTCGNCSAFGPPGG